MPPANSSAVTGVKHCYISLLKLQIFTVNTEVTGKHKIQILSCVVPAQLLDT